MRSRILILILASLVAAGCLRTRGTLDIKGKVYDFQTGALIPGRKIIINGLAGTEEKHEKIYVGQIVADSMGAFSTRLNKIKDVYYYYFDLVGDSDYAFKSDELGLMEMKLNRNFLAFRLNKLVDLSINLHKKSKKSACDTISVYWDSGGEDGENIYPYEIKNFGVRPVVGLCWIGGNVTSTIKARVYADKKTRIHWELLQNGRKIRMLDTITCRRDFKNKINFIY